MTNQGQAILVHTEALL